MQEILINHPRLHLAVKSGKEGPKHDPYGFIEYHIKTPKGITTLHEGAWLSWARHNGLLIEVIGDTLEKREEYLRNEFLTHVSGYSLKQLLRIARKMKGRCRCGSREFNMVSGYPGETFLMCIQCNQVHAGWFDIETVI